jgi:hypothetical protein
MMLATRTVLFAVALLASASLAIAQIRLPGFGQRKPTFKTFTSGNVSIEYPDRDWQLYPGSGSALLILTREPDAIVALHRTKLRQPQTPDDIDDLFVQLEGDEIKDLNPTAADLTLTVVPHANLKRVVNVTFSRPGSAGKERVRQVIVPMGDYVYRVVCSARSADFVKNEPVFEHVIQSLKVGTPIPKSDAR